MRLCGGGGDGDGGGGEMNQSEVKRRMMCVCELYGVWIPELSDCPSEYCDPS